MSRNRHPNAIIEKAIQYAEENGWRIKVNKKGHAWGQMYCPGQKRGACKASINSTPSVPENHAKQIIRRVDNCDHNIENDDE